MALIAPDDDVIFRVAINDHPLVVGEDDDRPAEELVEAVEERTEVSDDLDFPGWRVFVSDPPDDERLRYVNTDTRINVLAPQDLSAHQEDYDVFDAVEERLDVEGFDMSAMSSFPAEHPDDFDGEIHLDLTDE